MRSDELLRRFAELANEQIPLPAMGNTPERHRRLAEAAREDVSLAKLIEAHWDAVAILAEAGRVPHSGAIYGVWASEIPGKALRLETDEGGYRLSGKKMFCSGAGLIDRALITSGDTGSLLVEVDLRENRDRVEIDASPWHVDAFRMTSTCTVTFDATPVPENAVLGGRGWYTARAGFWHGACGPAACWAGGAAGLLDFAMLSSKQDPHTMAHLAAIHANVWALETYLDAAGREIDNAPADATAAQKRALQVRYLVEQACTDTLRRFARAFGPQPLSMNPEIARRYQETDLYLRQSHAERDLESLARLLRAK